MFNFTSFLPVSWTPLPIHHLPDLCSVGRYVPLIPTFKLIFYFTFLHFFSGIVYLPRVFSFSCYFLLFSIRSSTFLPRSPTKATLVTVSYFPVKILVIIPVYSVGKTYAFLQVFVLLSGKELQNSSYSETYFPILFSNLHFHTLDLLTISIPLRFR